MTRQANPSPANDAGDYLVAALYHFVSVPGYRDLREPLQALCDASDVRGTLLLAHEGINGTIAGPEAGVRAVWIASCGPPGLSVSSDRALSR